MRNLSLAMVHPEPTPGPPPSVHEYKSMCTTCIIGSAVEESKSGSFDEESEFCRFDLLDPDFPLCQRQGSPEAVLMDLCGGFAEHIVKVIGDMEASWVARCTKVKESDYEKARALWGFAKERAGVYIDRVYGCDSGAEFERMGEALFNCA